MSVRPHLYPVHLHVDIHENTALAKYILI